MAEGVEIPVIIDIDKAFNDAAKRVGQAIKPMQKAVDVNALEVKVELSKKEKTDVLDFVGSTKRSMSELKRAIKSVEEQLNALYAKKGGNLDLTQGEGKALTEAHIILTQVLAQRKGITQEIRTSTQEILEQASAERQHQAALNMTANTVDALNMKLSAWKKELNSAQIGSTGFEQAAKNAANLSFVLEQVNNQIRIIGANTNSIDQLNAKLQDINSRYNALSGADRKGAKGKSLLNEYKAISAELNKSGKSLQQMIQEEQRLSQLKQKGISQRRYENSILNSTVKTIRVLQEQERILSGRLNSTAVGSSAYERLKKQLQAVRDEIAKINRDIEATGNKTANLDTLIGNADSKLGNLVKRSAQLVALHSASRFIRNVREVTAEFEMQRVALGGIIQDTAKAESLFKQLKAAAIKSPFEIKDLVSFTKQLSAYRIETDKLFNVTMQLADVSAGLGVDMSRLVLAYGQVRAASVLRGQELRQFTEAGIPLVELLADKFTELNGRMVSTADVFDLISKRAVSFSMVEEIFNDMTESGGMFYKMQEKQSETLLGQWQKLRDALSIMYDEIGNTSSVHSAMESMLADAMRLMQNWRLVAGVIKAVGIQFAGLKVLSLFLPSLAKNAMLAKRAEDMLARSIAAADLAAKTGSKSFARSAANYDKIAMYLNKAAMSANVFKQAWYRLAASVAGGGWIGIVVTALSALVGYLVSARKEAQRLGKELSENIGKGALQIQQAERNFKRLADAAVQAAEGSAAQRNALKELQRTYGDVIPSQDLQIAKLREMQGEYGALTDAIKQKIEAQIHEQNINNITETYGTKLGNIEKQLLAFLKTTGKYTTDEATRIINGIKDAVKDELLTTESGFHEAAKIIGNIIKEQTGAGASYGFISRFLNESPLFGQTYFRSLLGQTEKFNTSLEEEEERFNALNNKMGRYAKLLERIRTEMKNTPEGFTLDQQNTFEFNQAKWKQAIQVYRENLEKLFEGIDISSAFATPDMINFSEIVKHISQDKGTKELKAFVEGLQKDYLNLAPQEATTRLVTQAAEGFAESVGIAMTKVQGYLKKDETSMTDYAKSVEDFVEAQQKRIQELTFSQKNFREGVSNYVRPSDQDIANEQQELAFLEKMLEFVREFLKEKNTGGSYQQDPWILIYQNRMKFMQDFRKGVEDLDAYLTHSQAVAKQQEIMEGRGASLNIDVKQLKGSREELMKWYDDTIDAITKKIHELGGKTWSGLGVQAILAKDTKSRTLKAWQDLLADVFKQKTDFDLSQFKNDLVESLNKVSEEIKQSETARNFYKDILSMTGDEEVAATMTISVYGGIGEDFKERLQTQLNKALESLNADSITDEMQQAFSNQDFTKILSYMDKFPEEWQKRLKEMAEDNQKYNADWIKDLMKTYEKSKTYEERIANVRRTESQTREEISKSTTLSEEQKQTYSRASEKKEAREIADIELEALQNTYEWTQAFKDMDRVSTETLTSLINMLEQYLEKSGEAATPESRKKVTEALESAQEQLLVRNAYAAVRVSLEKYIEKKKLLHSLEKQGKKDTLEYKIAQDEAKEALKDTEAAVSEINNSFNELSTLVSSVSDILDLDELSDGQAILSGIATGISLIGVALVFVNTMLTMIESHPIVAAISAGIALITGLGFAISNLKVAKKNREIKEQQKKIEALEEAYEELEEAISKAFGTDYIYNYNQQLQNLAAQQEAYQKQAQLEREKGKRKDEDKIKEYEKSAKDTAKKIRDMEGQLAEHFTGTDLTSAARSFEESWIDAYKTFASTTNAMRDKFKELIENMVTESLAAKIMQTILSPLFQQIDNMAKDGDLTAQDIADISNEVPAYLDKIDAAMNNLMTQLSAAGLNLREQAGSFTGIARDIAGASEESITGLAAGINTQNFYLSLLSQNVAAILAAMTGGTVEGATGATEIDPYKGQILEYIGSLPQMRDDMAAIRIMLERVIKPNGVSATYYVAGKF